MSRAAATIALVATLGACHEDAERVETDLGGAAACEDVSTWPRPEVQREDWLLEIVTALRVRGATCGDRPLPPVPPLSAPPELRCAARLRATDELNGELDHGSGDETPFRRMIEAEYAGLPRAELLAADFTEPEAVLDAWLAEPAYCQALLDGDVDHAAAGLAVSHDGSRVRWVVLTGETR